jgi:4-amino-4-deoxy-L-arabinose transferase-like glycosyltransferase
VSQTIWRQTQTAQLTRHFAEANFRLDGLFITTQGKSPVYLQFEFPIYNFCVGVFDKLCGHVYITGKLISFLCGGWSGFMVYMLSKRLAAEHLVAEDRRTVAYSATVFYILSPISVLMNTSYQPDSMGLALALSGLWFLMDASRDSSRATPLWMAAVLFTTSTLIKFPLVVPYTPLCCWLGLRVMRQGTKKAVTACMALICSLIPIVWWYVLRDIPEFGTMPADSRAAMLFIGDLARFLTVSYYAKPMISLVALMLSGVGLGFFAFGYMRDRTMGMMALCGLTFYLILIPTAADQYYYLYPLSPLFAIVCGIGYARIKRLVTHRHARVLALNGILLSWLVTAGFGWTYVLRQDITTLEAATALAAVSRPGDTVVFVPAHDRVIGRGSFNPALFYFSSTPGFNINVTDGILSSTIESEVSARDCDWVVITRYTNDLELPYGEWLPKRFRNDPGFDSLNLIQDLKEVYELNQEGKNWALFRVP